MKYNYSLLALFVFIFFTAQSLFAANPTFFVLETQLNRLAQELTALQNTLMPQQKYTQTEALLSIPAIKNLVYKKYPYLKTKRGNKFLKKILRIEKKYKATHYVFYHAFTKAWMVPQDLMYELTKKLRPLTSKLPLFRFLRWQDFERITAADFLMKEISSEGLINDNDPKHRASLLSVNLALFGNIDFEGESTFHYFMNPTSHATVSPEIIKGILAIFDLPLTHLDEILELDEKYLSPEKKAGGKPKAQILLQIFVPKKLVDDVGYLSWVQGIPYEKELVAMVDNMARTSLAHQPGFLTGTQPILKQIKDRFKNDKEKDPLYAKIMKHIKKGKFRLSTFLQKYTNEPATIPGIANIQARLLFTDTLLLNPSSNILFYTHDYIPRADKEKYKKELNSIVQSIVLEKLSKNKPSQPKKNAPSK